MLPPLSAPTFDAATPYPEVGVLRTALAADDWPAVRRLWAGQDWAVRSLLLRAVSGIERPPEVERVEALLRTALRDDPADPVAGPMLGCHLIAVGWRIRSSARAAFVSAEQFDRFHAHLRQAEAVLIEATARDPQNVAAWEQRVTIARGLQLGRTEGRRRYDKVAALAPHHLPAQMSYQQLICPKWDGSWDLLHSWSREQMLAAPEGSLSPVLVPLAHLEHWLALDSESGADAAYLRSSEVRNEIYEAANRSIGHPAFRRTAGWVLVLNVFAGLFGLMEDWRSAVTQFAALGPLATDAPWDYLGSDPGQAFMRYRWTAQARLGAAA